MMSKRYVVAIGINLSTLVAGIEFVTADGALATSLGTTPSPIEFVLSRGTPQKFRLMLDASIIDTPAYDILLGVEFIRAAQGGYCSYTEKFAYRYFGADGTLTSFSLSAPCHTSTPPIVASAFTVGLINSGAQLLDVQGSSDDQIPESEEEDYDDGYHGAPHQMAAARLRDASELRALRARTANHLTRRERALLRLQHAVHLRSPFPTPPILGLGGENGAFPIDTSACRLSEFSMRRGLHVVELFAGIGLGVLRTALAAGHNIRRYAYCDRDPVSRLIAEEVLQKLQQGSYQGNCLIPQLLASMSTCPTPLRTHQSPPTSKTTSSSSARSTFYEPAGSVKVSVRLATKRASKTPGFDSSTTC